MVDLEEDIFPLFSPSNTKKIALLFLLRLFFRAPERRAIPRPVSFSLSLSGQICIFGPFYPPFSPFLLTVETRISIPYAISPLPLLGCTCVCDVAPNLLDREREGGKRSAAVPKSFSLRTGNVVWGVEIEERKRSLSLLGKSVTRREMGKRLFAFW